MGYTTDMEKAKSATISLPTGVSLAQDFGFHLGVVFRAYVRAAKAIIEDLPGGQRGYQVLCAAVHGEATNQSALAQKLGIDRTVMTYLLDDLEAAQLVQRRPDPVDRRTRQIIATEKGEHTWQMAEQAMKAAEARVLSPIPQAEASTFRELLRRLAVAANQLDPVDNACDIGTDVGLDPNGAAAT
jgi:DNA-binding MarR family transcriptional regulator